MLGCLLECFVMEGMWNRFVNLVGGVGKILRCDIVYELLDKEFRGIWIYLFFYKIIFGIKYIV